MRFVWNLQRLSINSLIIHSDTQQVKLRCVLTSRITVHVYKSNVFQFQPNFRTKCYSCLYATLSVV